MKRSIIVLMLGSGAAALGILAWHSGSSSAKVEAAHAVAALERKVAQLSDQARRVQSEQLTVHAALSELKNAPRPAAPTPADSLAGAEPSEPPLEAEAPALAVNRYARPKEAFEEESRNAGWAAEMERTNHAALRSVPGVQVKSLECRTTTCRLELDYVDENGEQALQTAWHDVPALRNARMKIEHRVDDEGRPSGITIVALLKDVADREARLDDTR